MNRRSSKTKPEETASNPKAAAVRRILNIAQLVRTRGTPDEAMEALNWEKQLEDRLKALESEPESKAA